MIITLHYRAPAQCHLNQVLHPHLSSLKQENIAMTNIKWKRAMK